MIAIRATLLSLENTILKSFQIHCNIILQAIYLVIKDGVDTQLQHLHLS